MPGIAVAIILAANTYLVEGRRYFSTLDFEASARALSVAVEQSDLSSAELTEAFDLLARSYLATDRKPEAEATYVRMLRLNPYAETPKASPKIIECFVKAKNIAWPKPAVELRVTKGKRGAVVEVFDPWRLAHRLRYLEQEGTGGAVEKQAPKLSRFLTLEIQAGTTGFLDVYDVNVLLLAHAELAGAESSPTFVPVRVRDTVPLSINAKPRWGHWVLAGAAVVALILGSILVGLSFSPQPIPLSPADQINAVNEQRRSLAVSGYWSIGFGLATGLVSFMVGVL